ncbi:nucleotide sugar dehydrogenase [Methylosinus sp. H3A]|uniref:nucleotide sugar dehydrogenase n=1 Tax=Methylosinus sp. H3A TaxID=2785786 RepID=UPI0024866241|nr:nucleotide sugar dehydrogenase [Methylosinus sp. H3A]
MMLTTKMQQRAPIDALEERLRRRHALIGVIGLGYVGLPICIAAAEVGSRVLGFDVDPMKPEALAKGKSYLKHISDNRIRPLVKQNLIEATTNFDRLSEADALLICVPTPLDAHLGPDLSFVVATGEQIASRLRPGQLIILESTTYPGTTYEVLRPILETSGLSCDRDFYLAFSPEREDPGNLEFSTSRIPKVVGADSADARRLAVALYEQFVPRTVEVSSSATAEAVKLTENIFRAVNIALVNELKLVYGAMGIDVWEVIEAAKSKPFGYMPFYPGPGLGGHCIPIDPFYLTWKAREYGVVTRFIELAGEINSSMPQHVVNELARALDATRGRGLNKSRILVLGVAYKKNVDDIRESPSLRLIELLEARGAEVRFYDPYVNMIPETREHKSLAGRRSEIWDPVQIGGYDAVLIATDHDDVDYAVLASHAKLIVDTRNACRRGGVTSANVVLA